MANVEFSPKPPVLYHASENNDLVQLDPRTDEERLAPHPLLFATPYKQLAAMFLAPKTLPQEITKFNDRFILLVEGLPKNFIDADLGGTIYSLSSDSFSTRSDLQMPDTEYVTNQSVKPISKETYETAIDAMKQNEVSVYFTDSLTMQSIRQAKDHGYEIIKTLRPYYM